MNTLAKFVVVFVIYLQLTSSQVNGIRCFQCNSLYNSGCANLAIFKRELLYPAICDDFPGRQAFCRKTVIQVIEKNKQYDPRVIRSCGYIPHKNPCYRADNEGHTEQVCQCFEDGCNSAGQFSTSRLAYIAIFLFTTLFSICIY